MAKAAFRESGKPSTAAFVHMDGAGDILAAPGEGKAYVIYDLIFDSNSSGELQEASGGATKFVLPVGCCGLTSPIQWPTNTKIYFEGGASPRLTLTYDIIDV